MMADINRFSEETYNGFLTGLCNVVSDCYAGDVSDILDTPEFPYPIIFTFLKTEEAVVDKIISEVKSRLLGDFHYSGDKTFIDGHEYWSLQFNPGNNYEFKTIL